MTPPLPAATRVAAARAGRARWRLTASALGFALALTIPYRFADASGLYYTDRGVRPLSRGGAFVAGADDLHSIWYNPAGLSDAGTSVLVDFAWLHYSTEFTRQVQVPDAAGTLRTYTFPTVTGSTPVLPIPTIAGSLQLPKAKNVTLAAGIFAPYTAITSYPAQVDGQPSPSRYSLITMDGSAMVVTGGYISYRVSDAFRIGGGVQALVGTFQTRVMFSASPPDRLISAPEDPNYDALSQLSVGPIFAPSANLGATLVPEKHFRIGVSGQLPFWVDAPARAQVRLPAAAPFDNAEQTGDQSSVSFRLPAILRAGVEVRPVDRVRVEAAYVREFWSLHDSIDMRPVNMQLTGVTGFPSPFGISPISIPRNFQDSNSFRLGGEYDFEISGNHFAARIGGDYSTSAVPVAYVSPLTVDMNKLTVGLGGSIYLGDHWRFDIVAANVFSPDVMVDPGEARVPRVNPVQGNPTATESVNGGRYSATANVLGVGLNYKFK